MRVSYINNNKAMTLYPEKHTHGLSSFAFAVDMKPRYKDVLPQRLALHGSAFRMADIMLDSFQLQVDNWMGIPVCLA